MKNLSFYSPQTKPFLFGKDLVLGGYCNGSDAGMGKIAINNNKETNSDIIIYPNPTNTEFNIQSYSKIKEVIVSNSLGQVLLTTDNKKSISVESLSSGIYFVAITLENGEIQTKKLIIN